MFSRKLSVDIRLKRGFELLAGVLLAVILLGSTAWFFINEHNEAMSIVRSHAAILASHSEAALLFDDEAALVEDLAVLRHASSVRWAATMYHDKAVAQYGNPPKNLVQISRKLAAAGGVVDGFASVTLSQPIGPGTEGLGKVIIHADYSETNLAVLEIFVNMLLLAIALHWLGRRTFSRIVATVSAPLAELVKISDGVARDGDKGVRAHISSADEVGRLAVAFNRMLDAVSERENALTASRDELRSLGLRLQTTREEERTRIAHAIHDELGQQLTGLKLAVARACADENATRESVCASLAKIAKDLDHTVATVRKIAWELRPSILDALGLPDAIEWLAQDFRQRMGIRCSATVVKELDGLRPEVATDVFRSCQELLTNVMRHANATRVEIKLELGDSLRLEVADNGDGTSKAVIRQDSLGLLGLRERALRWGGSLEIGAAQDGNGTRIVFSLPRAGAFQREG